MKIRMRYDEGACTTLALGELRSSEGECEPQGTAGHRSSRAPAGPKEGGGVGTARARGAWSLRRRVQGRTGARVRGHLQQFLSRCLG